MNTNDHAQWTAVDQYFGEMLIPSDPVLEAALNASTAAGLPDINVAPNQGKFLMLLVQTLQARTILEIGTLGGYSTIWLTRGLAADVLAEADHLPYKPVITLEIDPKHAEVARANLARAGFAAVVDVQLGRAVDSLAPLIAAVANGSRPAFDFIFIDADKPSNPAYFEAALKLAHPGTLIFIDNVVRRGMVSDPTSTDPNVTGVRQLNEQIKAASGVTATTIQTVGSKGYDGFTLVRVNPAADR